MKNHSLNTKGLSMSQAQSISNLCNQACRDIDAKLGNFNNASKSLTIGTETYIETPGNPISSDLVELLTTKSALHAAQAFLMENIRAKDELLDESRTKRFIYNVLPPTSPELKYVEPYDDVTEEWAKLQLSKTEYAEFLEAEAFAAHFGRFIHKGGKLDKLRVELPNIKTLEWIEVEDGKKTPMKVQVHHTIDQLGGLHETLAAIHRKYEQRVNYYKAKIKNLVTTENARLAREYANALGEINKQNEELLTKYESERKLWGDSRQQAAAEFEEMRQQEIAQIAALRIEVAEQFKPVIDKYLAQLDTK
jgi:hypothetical protein